MDDGGVYYVDTLVLDVPAGAAGVNAIGFDPDLRPTFLIDPANPIPIAVLEPAVVCEKSPSFRKFTPNSDLDYVISGRGLSHPR